MEGKKHEVTKQALKNLDFFIISDALYRHASKVEILLTRLSDHKLFLTLGISLGRSFIDPKLTMHVVS